METMGFFGTSGNAETEEEIKKETDKLLKEWAPQFPQKYVTYLYYWIEKRDIVAKEMGLTEIEKLLLTKWELLNVIIIHLREKHNYVPENYEYFRKTKGTTSLIELIASLIDRRNETESKCGRCFKKFHKRMDKLSKSQKR